MVKKVTFLGFRGVIAPIATPVRWQISMVSA